MPLLGRNSQYRLKRGPVLALLLLIGLVGAFVIARSSTRPQVEALPLVTVPEAHAGTTYAVDGLVCLKATAVGARVTEVEAEDATPTVELVQRPQGAPPAIAYPVAPDGGSPLEGLELDRGEERCVRVLGRSDAQGDQRAGPLEVRFAYGPLGLLRAGVAVTPQLLLQVRNTGTDPRLG